MTATAPWRSHGQVAVLGTGAALPGAPVSTAALLDRIAQRFPLSRRRDATAIAKRLRIGHRHVCRDFEAADEEARPGDANPDLAARATAAALADAGLEIDGIGMLIGHTATPVQPLPGNVAFVADRLRYKGPYLELRQACTGFASALMIAFGLLALPGARPVAIVGSETGSLFFDPGRADADAGQLVNMVQMGDGAAAIILAPARPAGARIEAAWSGTIGLDRTPGLQRTWDRAREFRHDFAAILAEGPSLFDAGRNAAAAQGVALDAVDTIIPHQVSGRIGGQLARRFGVAEARFFVNGDVVGNTGSAAIWLALAQLRAAGLAPGHRVVALGTESTKYMYGGFVYRHG